MGDIHDLGRPSSVTELAGPAEQYLVESDRCRRPDAVRVLDQPAAVVHNGVHRGVPVTTQILRDFRHGSTVTADLELRPPASSLGDRRPLACNAIISLDKHLHIAHSVRTSPL